MVGFENLQAHHDRESFDCGAVTLNEFLRKQARQNADRNVGVTHVAVEMVGASRVLAYYTLVTRTVESAVLPSRKLPGGEIGVVLLGRLAVDKREQRRGLGRLCLLRAMHQIARAADDIGIYALVLHTLDESAKGWYMGLDFGFETLLDDPSHLFLPVATIRQALAAE